MAKSTHPSLLPKAEFYMYIGLCITAWAEVEEELFSICADVLGTNKELASVVFYRVPVLAARLALVDELILSALPKRIRKEGGHDHPDVKSWKLIKQEIEGLCNTRNRIAHHPVEHGVGLRFRDTGEFSPIPIGQSIPLDNVQFETSYWLYVSQAERLRGRHPNLRPLRTDDLSLHCQSVQRKVVELKQFRSTKLKPHLRSRAQQAAKRALSSTPAAVRLTIARENPPQSSPRKS